MILKRYWPTVFVNVGRAVGIWVEDAVITRFPLSREDEGACRPKLAVDELVGHPFVHIQDFTWDVKIAKGR
jgi:hypothetical protein